MPDVASELHSFFAQFRRLEYKKGQLILRAEDTPSGIYYLNKGFVKLFSISENGQELILIIVKPGDLFPIRWAVTGERHRYYFEAMTPIEVFKCPVDEFNKFIKTSPDVSIDVLQRVLTRLGGLLERMEYQTFGNAYQKVASILVICAERFGVKRERQIVIKVPLTHADVANLIGLTRETASVELKKLEKKGICEKEGRFIVVKSIERLKTEANWSKFV